MKRAMIALITMSAGCVDSASPMGTAEDPDPATLADIQTSPETSDVLPKAIYPAAELAHGPLATTTSLTPTAITYHGGPVMLGPTKTYMIWYGSWANNTAMTILPYLVTKLGGTPYFKINTTYGNATGGKVPNALAYGGAIVDSYSQGTTLTDQGVWKVVNGALAANKLPTDPNGVYVVLSSPDVAESSGFCTAYCGWHTYGYRNGTKLRFVFVGGAARCLSACAPQAISPNGNPGADGMASTLTHEIEETVTDPDLNAWFDAGGAENADKCAWKFGPTYATANGARANVKIGTRDFLIQQNWLNVGLGSCAMSY
ncbi:MAG: EXORDIUM family protein [Deltaproteobacteria bacterium]|nr:EXORDIUM family protein [Deltaproteobacteria bacterium]